MSKPAKQKAIEVTLHERIFLDALVKAGLPKPVKEHLFHVSRKWRFDFCWQSHLVAVEVEGGVSKFFKSRHTTADGYKEDCVKYNAATVLGWRVLRYDWNSVSRPESIAEIASLLSSTKASPT